MSAITHLKNVYTNTLPFKDELAPNEQFNHYSLLFKIDMYPPFVDKTHAAIRIVTSTMPDPLNNENAKSVALVVDPKMALELSEYFANLAKELTNG